MHYLFILCVDLFSVLSYFVVIFVLFLLYFFCFLFSFVWPCLAFFEKFLIFLIMFTLIFSLPVSIYHCRTSLWGQTKSMFHFFLDFHPGGILGGPFLCSVLVCLPAKLSLGIYFIFDPLKMINCRRPFSGLFIHSLSFYITVRRVIFIF